MAQTQSLPLKFWKWLSGYGLATTLLVLLGVQTWLATLEQVEHGLLDTLNKYFHWRSWYVLAELWVLPQWFDRPLRIPLPGGYWVCALLLVNMICGGLIRARKGWKTVGVLISHFGIIFMIAAGGVSQLFEQRGVMILIEGQRADYAVSLTDPTIEVMEIGEGKVVGDVSLAGASDLAGLATEDTRLLRFPDRPFDLEIFGWVPNAIVRPGSGQSRLPTVDGWTLRELEENKEAELDGQACYARVVHQDGLKGDPFILAVPNPRHSGSMTEYAPQMVEADGKQFAIRMVKQTIPVPFKVKLDDAVAEYFPNSSRPKAFHSDIERIEETGEPAKLRIQMNEPMRAGGFTFFQRTMGTGPQVQEGPEFSGFEVVSNPADKWPEYSLYVVTVGLLIHFLMKFSVFLGGSPKPKPEA
ncbi:MAG: cytochrome c biogenesis protein ResB [Verrucomicrobiota bacterium]